MLHVMETTALIRDLSNAIFSRVIILLKDKH